MLRFSSSHQHMMMMIFTQNLIGGCKEFGLDRLQYLVIFGRFKRWLRLSTSRYHCRSNKSLALAPNNHRLTCSIHFWLVFPQLQVYECNIFRASLSSLRFDKKPYATARCEKPKKNVERGHPFFVYAWCYEWKGAVVDL